MLRLPPFKYYAPESINEAVTLKNEFGDISESFVGKDLRKANLNDLNVVGHDLTGDLLVTAWYGRGV